MSESNDVLLGRILATVAGIDEKVGRLVWRADNTEQRLEALEKWRVACEATATATAKTGPSLKDRIVERGIMLVLGMGVAALFGTKILPLL